MKSIGKATMMILITLWLMIPARPVTAAMGVDDAPESVTINYLQELYEGVEFDHKMHTGMYACNGCHHHTTGSSATDDSCIRCHANPETADDVSCSACHDKNQSGIIPSSDGSTNIYHIDKPSLKGALHLQCVGCHQSESGPTDCLDCHDFTPEGKKRFKVKD